MNQNLPNNEKEGLVAVQCLWNSDWDYIGLSIELVYKTSNGYESSLITELSYSNFNSEESMTLEAERIAKEYIDKYNIILYFPSPNVWSRDCPSWWKSHDAPKCEDCQVPIIPSDSEYLPKEVCYPCHLARVSNEKIKKNLLFDDGTNHILPNNTPITYRDDSVLRFVYYASKNKASKSNLFERYKNVLTEEELLETISKLEKNQCLKLNDEGYMVTELGKSFI